MSNSVTIPPPPSAAPKPLSREADTQQVDGFGLSEKSLPSASKLIWLVVILVFTFIAWAWYFKLDEVSTGTGKVVASSKEQVIKSLEGGVVASLRVQEGEIVEKGQILAQLDRTPD